MDRHPGPPAPDPDAPLLAVRDLAVDYGGAVALRGTTLAVRRGEAVGLIGESGAGKSTLARAVAGLLPGAAGIVGSIRLAGRELVGASERSLRPLRGSEVATIFQEPGLALNPVRRVGSQLSELLALHRGDLDRRGRRREGERLLERVGLDAGCARGYPHELSGGQRQRVAIALALAGRPRLLVADEPTSALDPVTARLVTGLLRDARREHGAALLLISHDLEALRATVERALVMYRGRIVEEGPLAALLASPLHPYTRGLLGCLPPLRASPDRRSGPRLLPVIPPEAHPPGRGCGFEPRCAERRAECAEAIPASAAPAVGRRVECVLHGPPP